MGEAWFMGTEREMYPQLLGDLDALPDEDIARPLEEIASGSSSFGAFEEWIEWYHYLLPRLILRQWVPTYYHPAELLITAFMAQHPTPTAAYLIRASKLTRSTHWGDTSCHRAFGQMESSMW